MTASALRYRNDRPADAAPVALAAFLADPAATAVRIAPADDVRALLPHLGRIALVEIAFPAFRDGRGYSAASILREAGYAGELRAAGDVLVDQVPPMRRCGFDGFAPDVAIDPDVLARALARYDAVYQPAADGRTPAWARRGG